MTITSLRENKILLALSFLCLTLLFLPLLTYKLYSVLEKNELIICFAISIALLLLFLSSILISLYNNSINQKKLFLSYNKSLPNLNYEDLVQHAKLYNKSPISKDSYNILLKAREMLVKNDNSTLKKKQFTENELKLLSKVGRILFNNLEVELLIAKDDYIKLEKINEILIVETIHKIRNSAEIDAFDSLNESNLENEQNDISETSDRKKLH